ncbi:MAG: helix-hairpin-helix domain-containing protein [Lachnospiraceae bacterium]|nr:helix-hairpin-helix domain-containing protein [Lachnospiraceae bacterium]
MRKIRRGLATALLCFAMAVLSGCGKQTPLYTAGLSEETESARTESGRADDSGEANIDGESFLAAGSENNGAADTENDGMTGTGADGEVGAADGTATNAMSADTSASETSAGLDTGTDSGQTEAVVGYVYVCGAVMTPGVYPITADMRVCDAIELAGGFSAEADEEWLNQASTVSDGQKLYVYTKEETDLMKESGMTAEGMGVDSSWSGSSETVDSTTNGTAAGSGASDEVVITDGNVSADGGTSESGSSVAASDGKVNINTATREELMTLPGIGESKADAILAYRSEHGAFASIEEIQNISGIKSGVFSQIKDLITV